MKYRGSCHCGKIAFEVDGDLTGAMACNCSIIPQKVALWFVPRQVEPTYAEADIATAPTNVIKHRFAGPALSLPRSRDPKAIKQPPLIFALKTSIWIRCRFNGLTAARCKTRAIVRHSRLCDITR
jgi:hypothetical protein